MQIIMNIKKFNYYFLIYLSLLFFFGIFWLYTKHLVGNDSTISEWLINYQGGFTKRGLIGEICFRIAKYFDLSLRFVIFLFQSLIYSIFLVLIYRFFKNTSANLIIIFSIFTPIFLLYPIAEVEVLARKETFVFIAFLLLSCILGVLRYTSRRGGPRGSCQSVYFISMSFKVQLSNHIIIVKKNRIIKC